MGLSAAAQRRTVLLLAAASLACAPAPREGDSVHVAEESAIIIWDAAAKTQHFIRRASFETSAKDFGFLVPTPTVPKFEEADDQVFALLDGFIQPRLEAAKSEPAPKSVAPASVTVVATAKVAGYDAVVLEATDAEALNRWLKENGYASSPELVEWFKPYIEKKWRISAFKVSAEAAGGSRLETRAVRMSFQTEQPFFPYREPQNGSQGAGSGAPRLLRVYFLGEGRVEGKIGDAGAWQGRPIWSNAISGARDDLMDLVKLPRTEAPAATWLTVFEDRSSPRAAADELFFAATTDKAALQQAFDRASNERAAERTRFRSNLALLLIFIAAGVIAAFVWWRVAGRK